MIEMVRAYYRRLSARRRYRETQEMISKLPEDILKDIGWPGSAPGPCAEKDTQRSRACTG